MKKKYFYLLFLIISILIFPKEKNTVNIGIIYDDFVLQKEDEARFLGNNELNKTLIEKEILSLAGGKYNINFPSDKQLYMSSSDKKSISEKIDTLLKDEKIDIVITAGLIGSQVAWEKSTFSKPIFAPLVISKGNSQGKEQFNFNYISNNLDFNYEIQNFNQIYPFKKLTILIGENMAKILESTPMPSTPNIQTEIFKINDSNVNEVLDKIKDSEAIALGPIKELNKNNQILLMNTINKNSIPSFSIFSINDESFKTLAQYSFEKEYKKRIRTTALNIIQYLEGKDISKLTVQTDTIKPELILNMESIKTISKWPDWSILAEAKLINFLPENSLESLSLKEVIKIALENSSKVKTLQKEFELAELNLEKVKSKYKPRIDVNATGLIIDKDRAESLITPAEQTLSAGVSLTQVILNEDLNMNIDILKSKMKVKEEELKKTSLDLILETSEAYMAVLKIEAFARIQKNNLELTKRNLELAKERKAAGLSGQGDIYRLESELSKNVSAIIEAMLNIDIAKTNLKRIINYQLDQNIELENITLDSKDFLTSNNELFKHISNQNNANVLVKYLLEKAIEDNSDLKNIDYGIEIQERLAKNATKKRYTPTIGLKAGYTVNNIIAEGAGTTVPNFKSIIGSVNDSNTKKALGAIVGAFGNPDEFEWSVAIGFNLPIYNGGELKIDKKIAEKSIETLEEQKNMLTDYTEQQIITNVSKIVSEYAKIKNADISLNSAQKALDIVKDAYYNGVSPIYDLISAQSAAFSAEQYKVTIQYDLMAAIMRAERLTGDFYILKSEQEKEEFSKTLK